ncbi:hypothetical protein NL676_017495 [Syzygium grande]|nr:hypothetical protein NL676_017495 [Syzygium grande]
MASAIPCFPLEDPPTGALLPFDEFWFLSPPSTFAFKFLYNLLMFVDLSSLVFAFLARRAFAKLPGGGGGIASPRDGGMGGSGADDDPLLGGIGSGGGGRVVSDLLNDKDESLGGVAGGRGGSSGGSGRIATSRPSGLGFFTSQLTLCISWKPSDFSKSFVPWLLSSAGSLPTTASFSGVDTSGFLFMSPPSKMLWLCIGA